VISAVDEQRDRQRVTSSAAGGNRRTFRMEESGLCGATSVTTAVCVSGHTLLPSACDHLRTTHTHTHTHCSPVPATTYVPHTHTHTHISTCLLWPYTQPRLKSWTGPQRVSVRYGQSHWQIEWPGFVGMVEYDVIAVRSRCCDVILLLSTSGFASESASKLDSLDSRIRIPALG